MDAMRVHLTSEPLGTGAGRIRQQRLHGGGERGGTLLALDESAGGRSFSHITPALAAAVAPLLADSARARAQGLAGQVHAHRVHDWEALARTTMRIYSEAPSRA